MSQQPTAPTKEPISAARVQRVLNRLRHKIEQTAPHHEPTRRSRRVVLAMRMLRVARRYAAYLPRRAS